MKSILVVGKGEPSVSLIQSLSDRRVVPNQSEEIAYYLKHSEKGMGKWCNTYFTSPT